MEQHAPAGGPGVGVGVVTIGQSPRADMLPEMRPHWHDVVVHEAGALDGLHERELEAMSAAVASADPEDEVLTSRLRDGSSLTFTRSAVLPLVQQRIDELEAAGVAATLLVCTGTFPPLQHARPLHPAESLLVPGVSALATDRPIGVICPLPAQRGPSVDKFGGVAPTVWTADADPYGAGRDSFTAAGHELTDAGSELLVLDCMGYTEQHRAWVAGVTDVPVVLARSIVARLFGEIIAALPVGRGTA